MATRTRVISQSKAVYVTPTGWDITEHASDVTQDLRMISGHQLHRIDNASFEIDLAGSRQDVREFGQLSRISTVRLSEIDPTLSLGYFLGNGENELALGFDNSSGADTQIISSIINEDPTQSQRNIFIATVKEGEDAFTTNKWNSEEDSHDVVGFGNCFINSYSVNLSVGEIPRVDLEVQASNVVFWTGCQSGLFNPSLNLEGDRTHSGLVILPPPDTGEVGHAVLRPHDVSVTFVDDQISNLTSGAAVGGVSFSTMPIQSCSIEIPLAREVIESLGSERAYAKPVQFPIDVTVSISSLVNEYTTGALEFALNGSAGNKQTNINIEVKDGNMVRNKFVLTGALLDSQSFSQGLDDNETVDLTFSAQIGGASSTDQGLMFTAATGASDGISGVFLTGMDGTSYVVAGAAATEQPIQVNGWVDLTGEFPVDSLDGDGDGNNADPDGYPDAVI
tara:strand:+ start:2305 stop:3654 length:1350 start_codon:yes stop_codon:yes gene_type:complete